MRRGDHWWQIVLAGLACMLLSAHIVMTLQALLGVGPLARAGVAVETDERDWVLAAVNLAAGLGLLFGAVLGVATGSAAACGGG